MSHHANISKKLKHLFDRLDGSVKIIKSDDTNIEAIIYGMKYKFKMHEEFISYIRENDPMQIGLIDDDALDGAENLLSPYLKYFDRINSKSIPKCDVVPEKCSDPAVLTFFLCPGDCYICYENSHCAAPMVSKAQTLCAVDGS